MLKNPCQAKHFHKLYWGTVCKLLTRVSPVDVIWALSSTLLCLHSDRKFRTHWDNLKIWSASWSTKAVYISPICHNTANKIWGIQKWTPCTNNLWELNIQTRLAWYFQMCYSSSNIGVWPAVLFTLSRNSCIFLRAWSDDLNLLIWGIFG